MTFPAAEVALEFLDPADEGDDGGAMFPTGHLVDRLDVPGVGSLAATLINAGIPTIFLNAQDLGYTGCELQDAINTDDEALARFEAIRAHGALQMGLIRTWPRPPDGSTRQRSPLWRHRPPTRHPAASALNRVTWTCWCAPCPWASCTTP